MFVGKLLTPSYGSKSTTHAYFLLDDLPTSGFVGTADNVDDAGNAQYYLNTHKDFLIEYNKDRVG
jgi:hypothetical protein